MSAAEPESSFPQWVAWSSLVLALALFFGNTVGAVRERNRLRALGADLHQLRQRYDEALLATRPASPTSSADLQTLLVAIDQLGLTPAELLASWPEPASDNGANPSSRGSTRR